MTHSPEELRRLASEAAPGPWVIHPYVDAIDIRDANGFGIATLSDRVISDHGMPPENARFISAARTAIPELLDALEAAQRDAERWRWIRGDGLMHVYFEGLTTDTSDVGLDCAADYYIAQRESQ